MLNCNISFRCCKSIYDVKQQWFELDRKAQELNTKYIDYTYYQTYEWNEFLFRHITSGFGKLTTEMSYDLVLLNGKPFAVIPMAITRMSKKTRIPSCRVAGVLNMSCPYVEECSEDVISSIAAYIRSRHKGLKLSFADVPQVAPLSKVMVKICSSVKERSSYHVPLSEFATHDEYVSSLHKNIYKNIRKSYNHLKTDDKTIELKHFRGTDMPSDAYLMELWKLYFRRKMAWRHKKISWLSMVANNVKAMLETSLGCASRSLKLLSVAELYVLEIDHRPAAFMIVYRHRNHLLMPKLAIDTSFSRYSPGILLILESSKEWIEEGVADFDMCRGDERYKKEMGGINEPLCRIDKILK